MYFIFYVLRRWLPRYAFRSCLPSYRLREIDDDDDSRFCLFCYISRTSRCILSAFQPCCSRRSSPHDLPLLGTTFLYIFFGLPMYIYETNYPRKHTSPSSLSGHFVGRSVSPPSRAPCRTAGTHDGRGLSPRQWNARIR